MVMKNNVFRKIMELLPILLIIGLFAALAYSIFYSSKLEEQIWERDKTIRELSFRSKLVEDYFDIEYNPDDSSTYYTLKDSKIPKKVVKEYEYKDREIERIIDRTPSFHIGDSTIALKEISKNYNLLLDSIYRIENLVRRQRNALKLIEKNYGVQFDYSVDSNKNMTIITMKNHEKIDSALILLPYYRNRLEKKEDGTWIIKLKE